MNIIVPKTRKDLTELVIGRWRTARTNMSENITKWRYLLEQYELGTENNLKRRKDQRGKITNANENIATVSSSVIWNAVEAISPRMIDNFDPEGWFSVVPRPYTNTTLESANFVENMLQSQMDECHANEVFPTAVKQAVKLGKSILKLRWDVEYGNTHDRQLIFDDYGNITGEEFVMRPGVVFEGPRIELVPWYNFYPDPKAYTMSACEYVVEELTMSIRELTRLADLGFYDKDAIKKLVDSIKRNSLGSDVVTSDNHVYFQRDSYRNDARIITYYENERVIHLGTTWGGSSYEGDILNYKKTDNPYGFIPYVDLATNVDELKFFPSGVIESVRDDHAILSTLMQMSLDAGVMELRPMRAFPKDFGIDIKKLQNYVPNKIIEYDYDELVDGTRGFNDFYHEFKPDPHGFLSTLPQLMGLMMAEAQKKTRVTDYLTGSATTGSNKTARGAALLSQNAETGIGVMTHILAMGATRMLEMMLEMNRMFNYNPQIPQYGKYNFKVFESSTADEQMRMQTLMWALPIIAQMGGDVVGAVKRVLRIARVPAVDKLLPGDGSMDKNKQEQMAGQVMQMLLNQGQQGGGAQNV